ncbi:hypothetical protein COU17_02370 [Candidatus Kaiserbacteria bacterium CG10_big_fil_rev_8_21_14_0_10_49_17]|uniref:Uncharacterized protein n=1 Tax=Candidatus Kaiserbacteria bacterium CG10_big_fil_rev_8_21_14_0_10_49_17 TaxID=1974609 RepID=A0A2M6WE99_9BACT|nr:MAG: hypothetical protein COU17_02370 [Candidatus Kaiserbacteria bacterium CG10_big_fil_rev_8_21_14_0_10_49_17]
MEHASKSTTSQFDVVFLTGRHNTQSGSTFRFRFRILWKRLVSSSRNANIAVSSKKSGTVPVVLHSDCHGEGYLPDPTDILSRIGRVFRFFEVPLRQDTYDYLMGEWPETIASLSPYDEDTVFVVSQCTLLHDTCVQPFGDIDGFLGWERLAHFKSPAGVYFQLRRYEFRCTPHDFGEDSIICRWVSEHNVTSFLKRVAKLPVDEIQKRLGRTTPHG